VLKTHACGELRTTHIGQAVMLAGWVHRRRDHGGLIFIDLRDREGLVQVVFNPAGAPDAHAVAARARSECVLHVSGTVRRRPPGLENPNMATGEVEVVARQAEILNEAKTPPFYITDAQAEDVDEALRLQYRYLDLRRERMQRNLLLRHRVVLFIRDYLAARGFVEIETPILIKSTPEGARDYLVPSRVHPGAFYALPQSPQQLKQLLMVAGFEKYFQIARCFRDEDPRADRQPEFTQLDLEMSFVEREDILRLIEDLFTALVREVTPHLRVLSPFPRLTYQEAMERYGSDKPDLRFGLPLVDLSDLVAQSGFQVFASTVARGGQVKGVRAPGCAGYTRRQVDELTDWVKQQGAPGLTTIAVDAAGIKSPLAKYLTDAERDAILSRLEAGPGDLLLIVADTPQVVANALGGLRLEIARRLELADANLLAFAWVLDFPLLEWKEDEQRWEAVHHPFTSPKPEDAPLMDTEPGRVRANAYDLVCNGYEIGGGSIRIHRREMQEKMFALLKIRPEEQRARFGHMLDAFEFGAPPHGGIAPGIDRLVMLLAGESNIREVMAFPKTATAQDLMMQAPSPVDEAQLRELHLRITAD